jgi:hypothetical protein
MEQNENLRSILYLKNDIIFLEKQILFFTITIKKS